MHKLMMKWRIKPRGKQAANWDVQPVPTKTTRKPTMRASASGRMRSVVSVRYHVSVSGWVELHSGSWVFSVKKPGCAFTASRTSAVVGVQSSFMVAAIFFSLAARLRVRSGS